MSERDAIDRGINRLYRAMNVYAACGNAEDVNRIRDEIGELERQKQTRREDSDGRRDHLDQQEIIEI